MVLFFFSTSPFQLVQLSPRECSTVFESKSDLFAIIVYIVIETLGVLGSGGGVGVWEEAALITEMARSFYSLQSAASWERPLVH